MALKDIEPLRHDVELREFHHLHVWIWRLQYLFMTLVIAAAAFAVAGLFGHGALSRTEQSAGGASVVYQRFARYANEIVLEVRLAEATDTIELPLDYFGCFELQRIVPQPRVQRIDSGRLAFVFDASGGVIARFYLLPLRPGLSVTTLTAGAASFEMRQLTYP